MPELQELIKIEKLEKQVAELVVEVKQKEIELKVAQKKMGKRPSLGFYRSRFK